MTPKTKKIVTILGAVVAVAAVFAGLYAASGKEAFIRTSLSGLTLGSLFFLVAAGLTHAAPVAPTPVLAPAAVAAG